MSVYKHEGWRSVPHQNTKECLRRLVQVYKGQLSGMSGHCNRTPFVTEEAVYAVRGLTPPSRPTLT